VNKTLTIYRTNLKLNWCDGSFGETIYRTNLILNWCDGSFHSYLRVRETIVLVKQSIVQI
jgi:hypothetical protein